MNILSVDLLSEKSPCPFCGSREIAVNYIDVGMMKKFWVVGCRKCGASTRNNYTSSEEAVNAWNMRTTNGNIKNDLQQQLAIVRNQRDYLIRGMRSLLMQMNTKGMD